MFKRWQILSKSTLKITSMRKIEHIGIAVKDMQAATQIYTSLLGYAHYKTEQVASEGVNTAFFKCGESKIELLEPTNKESAIAKFIAKKGEGVHHIAFAVDDIKKETQRLVKQGQTLQKFSVTIDPCVDEFVAELLQPRDFLQVLREE